jgi:hypothetical protein
MAARLVQLARTRAGRSSLRLSGRAGNQVLHGVLVGSLIGEWGEPGSASVGPYRPYTLPSYSAVPEDCVAWCVPIGPCRSEKHCPFSATCFRSRFKERSLGPVGTGRFPT